MIALEEEPIRDFSPYLVSVYSLNYGQFTHDLSELFPSSQGSGPISPCSPLWICEHLPHAHLRWTDFNKYNSSV